MEPVTRLLKSAFENGYFNNASSILKTLGKEKLEDYIKHLLRDLQDNSELIHDILDLYLAEDLICSSCDYCEDSPTPCDSCIIDNFLIDLPSGHRNRLKIAYFINEYPEVINDYINEEADSIEPEDLFLYGMFGAELEVIVVRLLLERQEEYVRQLLEWYFPDGKLPWYVEDMRGLLEEKPEEKSEAGSGWFSAPRGAS